MHVGEEILHGEEESKGGKQREVAGKRNLSKTEMMCLRGRRGKEGMKEGREGGREGGRGEWTVVIK